MQPVAIFILCNLFAICAETNYQLFGHVYGNYTLNIGTKLFNIVKLAKNYKSLATEARLEIEKMVQLIDEALIHRNDDAQLMKIKGAVNLLMQDRPLFAW
jgi:hypothetical protein